MYHLLHDTLVAQGALRACSFALLSPHPYGAFSRERFPMVKIPGQVLLVFSCGLKTKDSRSGHAAGVARSGGMPDATDGTIRKSRLSGHFLRGNLSTNCCMINLSTCSGQDQTIVWPQDWDDGEYMVRGCNFTHQLEALGCESDAQCNPPLKCEGRQCRLH
jgi:hypothetical protein